jgi:protein-tyrosine phosphatase
MPARDRHITFEAGFNCRDLGGYPTDDGQHVRWGVLFRSGTLHRLTTADLETAKIRLGLRTVIDLRSTAELARTASFEGDAVVVHHAPLFEEDALPFKWAEPDDPEPPPGEDYVAIAETGADSLVLALKVIADGAHPVAFHCAAGKDRTGILASLLLSALGVSDDDIRRDYELTNLSFSAHVAWATLNDPAEAADIQSRPRWLNNASGSVIGAFLAILRARHGSIEGYLRDLGIDGDVVQTLRRRVLERP